MRLHQLRHPFRQRLFLWLVAATVLLRALVPDGFMPEHRKGHGFELAICSAGPLAALRAADDALSTHHDHGQPGQHDPSSHGDCPFAAAVAAALPGAVPGLPSLAAQAQALSAFAASAFLSASRLRPPSRAPPLFS